MATLGELVLTHTTMDGDQLAHVQRLALSWQILADLSFSDLLLLAPIAGEDGHRFVVLGQVRPTTGQTLYPVDLVGTVIDEVSRPLVTRAWRLAETVEGDGLVLGAKERLRLQCVPVRRRGEMIALVTREMATSMSRRPGELERVYVEAFEHFAAMLSEGTFPFERMELDEAAPRVGDGVIILDGEARIRFASPNAVSLLHHLGIHAYTPGLHLSEVGFAAGACAAALRAGTPVTEEVERADTSTLIRAIPQHEDGRPCGIVVLMRDVTDLRRRDRLLMSKDATIREIHHRVKNNLQTIAALLRLQRRRLSTPEARQAIAESERRIRSIAIVHETLSREAADVVELDEIVGPLARVVEEAVSADELELRFDVEGDGGQVPGEIATPLAVVLNELMQNAVDHAFPLDGDSAKGRVLVRIDRGDAELVVDVIDDGVGLPDDFSLETSKGLGLSIVQALVTTELNGEIEMIDEGGTRVHVRMPLAPKRRQEV